MAIAHLATEYVFSDFLLKEPPEPKFKGLRLELALDKLVTCVGVGLPLLLVSLAFAQEISTGSQISCFAPGSFSWRQAAFVDAYCWAALQQGDPLHGDGGQLPLWLHKFIMEELDKVYNRAIQAAKSARAVDAHDGGCAEPVGQSLWEISESHFKYPIVEQYLKTKKGSRRLIGLYLGCRLLTLVTVLLATGCLGYYCGLPARTDEFACGLHSGLLRNASGVPERVQCKLVAVGVFRVLSLVHLAVYVLLAPVVLYSLLVPLRQRAHVLRVYEILPTFDVLQLQPQGYTDLSLYNLFLEENVSELKSYKCLKVLESIKRSGQGIDPMLLLTNLGLIKMDVLDGRARPRSPPPTGPAGDAQDGQARETTEETQANSEEKNARQRLLNSS
ncbi:pannexin-1 isoform X2 [Sorex araneus]|uniref:pannexin-1 isoform X2 n=1 Tax=Sorex araneus TaxID=42254 RepID=UPI002433D6C9|nr:pannexin-1 isoform X2 [Sorex araneus]